MLIYRNEDMRYVIDSYVHNIHYRELLQLRYCDGLTYEEIACMVNFSPQHVKAICHQYKEMLFSHL